MRKQTEHHAGYNGHGKTEDDIASVVRLVGPFLVSGAVVTRIPVPISANGVSATTTPPRINNELWSFMSAPRRVYL